MTDMNRLLEKPCHIIDFLPRQVPKDCGGQFFKVENYLLNNYERYGLRDKYIRIILPLRSGISMNLCFQFAQMYSMHLRSSCICTL